MITPCEPQKELSKALKFEDLSFKREDLHPLGSHKGRSIPAMIDYYRGRGDRQFAISSSGNAALAAGLYIKSLNEKVPTQDSRISLDIFVGNNVNANKLKKIKELSDDQIRVLTKERPLQALSEAVNEGKRSLRQSTDDTALIGYESLAEELAENKKACAVFIGTSSGTTAQALAKYFIDNKLPIQVHIVQTSSCHPIADAFETFDVPDEKSLADAIVDRTAHRKSVLVPLIEKTGGRGWCATNDDIRTAQELVKKHTKLQISANGALSVVGAMQAAYVGYDIRGTIVCVIGGE